MEIPPMRCCDLVVATVDKESAEVEASIDVDDAEELVGSSCLATLSWLTDILGLWESGGNRTMFGITGRKRLSSISLCELTKGV